MKKRAKSTGKKVARKSAAKKPAAKPSAGSTKRVTAAAKPSRPAGVTRGAGPTDRPAPEAARYTPGPVQSTGWPPFRYPPR